MPARISFGPLFVVACFMFAGALLLTVGSSPQPSASPALAVSTDPPAGSSAGVVPTPAVRQMSPATPVIDLGRLYEAYAANEIAADRQYKERALRVRHRVTRVERDVLGGAAIVFEDRYARVLASMRDGQDDALAELTPRQRVTLDCVGGGKGLGAILLADCQIVDD